MSDKQREATLLEAIKANTEVGEINVSLQMELEALRTERDRYREALERIATHQHINPDGTLNAGVAYSAYIAKEALPPSANVTKQEK